MSKDENEKLKEKIKKIDPFKLVEQSGQMDHLIDLFSGEDKRISEEARKDIKEDVRKLTAPLGDVIFMMQEVVSDPEKLEALYREIRKQQNLEGKSKKKKDKKSE